MRLLPSRIDAIDLLFLILGPTVAECLSGKDGFMDGTKTATKGSFSDASGRESLQRNLGFLVRQIFEAHLEGCHVVFGHDGDKGVVFDSILRSLGDAYISEAIVDLSLTQFDPGSSLMRALKRGDAKFTCRVFFFDLTSSEDSLLALSFLESVRLFLISHTYVIFLGNRSHVSKTLRDRALWNTPNALYLAIPSAGDLAARGNSVSDIVRASISGTHEQEEHSTSLETKAIPEKVTIFSRCMYCDGGEQGFRLVAEFDQKFGYVKRGDLFKDQFRDLMGHQFHISTLDWFPIIDFTRNSKNVSTTVTPQDSVDVRMLTAIAQTLNFTYSMRVPWDNQWGTSTKTGNWTGIIGELQHHKADFSMVMSWIWGRFQVVDFSRIYASEPIVMIMSKPRPLPPYLALVRPLEGSVWGFLFISSFSAGFILWLLQCCWARISGEKGLSLDTSVLYTWSILFEEPPTGVPKNTSGQMFIGWWWLYCTLITVVYKSSLTSHLSVPGTSRAIDTFEELLREDRWTWGYEPSYGSGWEWFKNNENPTIISIFQGMEVMEFKEQMDRVLKGQHALITWKYKIKSLIAALYTDNFGYTPIYTAKSEYFNYGGYGWAFRKNAPFLRPIDMIKQRLIETGFVNLWMNDLIGTAAKKARDEKGDDQKQLNDMMAQSFVQESSGLVVLSLHHLQTVFYILFLGFSIAFVAFVTENVYHACAGIKSSKEMAMNP